MLVAKDDFAITVDGRRVVVHKGQTIAEDHPLVKRCPALFDTASADIPMWGEQATAAPSEIRTVVPVIEPHADMPLQELREMASDLRVPTYGSKGELVARIKRAQRS